MTQKPRSDHVPRGYNALPPALRERLDRYERMVATWSQRIDLVAPGELDRFRSRHLDDSLKALPLLAELGGQTAVDVGSGAGLPGIPLAIAEPRRRWTLLEPRRRRAAFLEEVVRALELDVEILVLNADEAAERGMTWPVATARALAAPARALQLVTPLLGPGGTAVVWVGSQARLPVNSALWGEGLATMPRTTL